MTTKTACRRRQRRFRLSGSGAARLELVYPQPNGADHTLPLLDISPSGLSFALEGRIEGVEAGMTLDGVKMCLSTCVIAGDILVIHVTEGRGVCGALFYPATDDDLLKLRSAVAALEVAGGGLTRQAAWEFPLVAESPLPPGSRSVADDVDHPLDPKSIRAGRLTGFLIVGGIGGLTFIGVVALSIFVVPLIGRIVLLSAWSVIFSTISVLIWRMTYLRWKYAAYRVGPNRIKIRRGVLWRSVIDVPRSRVQHTDVSQGPVERNFGLATLVIHTAGTQHASVSLGGLPKDAAYAIRDHLLVGGTGEGSSDDAV